MTPPDSVNLLDEARKHTPGPWQTNGLGGIFGGAATGLIAQVTRTANPDVMMADALLLAAAPELLQACDEALTYCSSEPCGTMEHELQELRRIERILRAAITKATTS